jgi:hypothetical protein
LSRLFGNPRAAGAWGIVFVVLLFASAAMVSLPTAAMSGDDIVAFYAAHATVIVIQQVVGVVALGAFIAFALSSPRNRWLLPTLWAFVFVELITNIIPLAILAAGSSPDTARTLTRVEDDADAVFSIAIAAFVAAASLGQPIWLRIAAYVVAVANVLRGVGDPLGFTALDTIAPLLFIAFVLVFSVKLLVGAQRAHQ